MVQGALPRLVSLRTSVSRAFLFRPQGLLRVACANACAYWSKRCLDSRDFYILCDTDRHTLIKYPPHTRHCHATSYALGQRGRGNLRSVQGGKFFVTITSTKRYNKWYMWERVNQILKKGMDEGKFRFEARMIRYDHVHWRYEYVNPVDSEWEPDFIFVLSDVSDIKE